MSKTSAAGACLCGEIQFSIELPALFCAHCHCTMCRRAHGAGYVTWFGVEKSRLSLAAGRDHLAWYDSSDHGRRGYCRSCGSSLFFESSHRAQTVDIVLASMSEDIGRSPEFHVYFDQRVDWVPLDDDLKKLGGTTGIDPIEND